MPTVCLAAALWMLAAAPVRAADPNDPPERRDTFDASVAYAAPLKGIKIDGQINDWPKDAIRYPILNSFGAYGPTHGDQDGYQPTDDLAAYFMVGYDAKAGLIYLAVVAQDDQHIIGRDCYTTDAVEVYLDSRPTGAPGNPHNRWPVHQYVAVPGNGSYRGLTATGVENPIFNGGPFEQTESSFAATRLGQETIYEFALVIYDQFPNAKTELTPGKRLGFDVVMVDKDDPAPSKPRWSPWGPTGSYKLARAELLGDLVLIGDVAEMGEIHGVVSRGSTGKPMAHAFVEAWTGETRAGWARANEHGNYALRLPPGRYQVQPGFAQGLAATQPSEVRLGRAEKVALACRAEPLTLPPVLVKAVQGLRRIQAYTDETTLTVTENPDALAPSPSPIAYRFTADRQGGIHIASLGEDQPTRQLAYDGRTLIRMDNDVIVMQLVTPRPCFSFGAIDAANQSMYRLGSMPLHRYMASGAYLHQLVLHPDPELELLRGLSAVRVVDKVKMDEQPATVIELTKSFHTVISGLHTGFKLGWPITMRLTITNDDGLIRRTAVDFPVADMANFATATPTRALLLSSEHRKISLNPRLKPELFTPRPRGDAPPR